MIIVVAGGIGTGKSTVMKILEDLGAKVIYADAINRELLLDEQYVKNIGVVFGQRSQLWWDVPVCDSFELLKDIFRKEGKAFEESAL